MTISKLTDFHPDDFVYIGLERQYGVVVKVEESYVFVNRQYTAFESRIGMFKPEYLIRVNPEGKFLELYKYLQSNPI